MATMKVAVNEMFQYIKEINSNWRYVYAKGDLCVICRDDINSYGNRVVSYLSSTHWDLSGIVRITFEHSGNHYLNWSIGGIVKDATDSDVAHAMEVVWGDVRKVLDEAGDKYDYQA